MRSAEHLAAGTPSAWSLRSRHPSRQRSGAGAGDRGRSEKKCFPRYLASVYILAAYH